MLINPVLVVLLQYLVFVLYLGPSYNLNKFQQYFNIILLLLQCQRNTKL